MCGATTHDVPADSGWAVTKLPHLSTTANCYLYRRGELAPQTSQRQLLESVESARIYQESVASTRESLRDLSQPCNQQDTT